MRNSVSGDFRKMNLSLSNAYHPNVQVSEFCEKSGLKDVGTKRSREKKAWKHYRIAYLFR